MARGVLGHAGYRGGGSIMNTVPFVWVEGFWIPADQIQISSSHRGLRLGDGIFESLRVHKKQLIHSAAHFQRLNQGVDTFRLNYDTRPLEGLCYALIEKNNLTEGLIRIHISRNDGSSSVIGYRPPAHGSGWCMISGTVAPLPDPHPVRLMVSSVPLAWRVPCKTTSALPYVMAMMEAMEQKYDNALMLTPHGIVCEATNANILWIQGDTLYTPAPELPFIPGTVAAMVLKIWSGPIQQGYFTLSDLKDYFPRAAFFLANVGSIITPIADIEGVVPRQDQFLKVASLRQAVMRALGLQ